MSERNYYVICDDNCRFEGMTKEQVIAAIAEATGNVPTDVDSAFITKIKEKNANKQLQFWVGTTAEYNALSEIVENTFYILTDDTFGEDVESDISAFREELDNVKADTGWREWSNNGVTIGHYRLVGKIAYFTIEVIEATNNDLTLPVFLDVATGLEVGAAQPKFVVIDSASKVNCFKYNSVHGTIYLEFSATASSYVSGCFSFPFGNENPNYVA